jgi:hypothetical protein
MVLEREGMILCHVKTVLGKQYNTVFQLVLYKPFLLIKSAGLYPNGTGIPILSK